MAASAPDPTAAVAPDALAESFLAAADKTREMERWYKLAGRVVRVRAAGTAMLDQLGPALQHLTTTPQDPELVIHLWDSASSGTPPPPLPPTQPDQPAGAFYHSRNESLESVYQPGLPALSAFSPVAASGWYWAADAQKLPFWERAAPIRQVLNWWMAGWGCQHLHGGAIGTEQGGILLVGPPGSGKSTTSLSSLGSALRYAGDDYVAVSLEPAPFVHSLYSSGKLDPFHATRFPHLAPALANAERPDDEKALFFVHDAFPDRPTNGFPLIAVVVPRVVDRADTAFRPAPRAVALTALAPSTIIQLHTAGQEALSRMRKLVERVPAYFLELGSDLDRIAPAVLDFVEANAR